MKTNDNNDLKIGDRVSALFCDNITRKGTIIDISEGFHIRIDATDGKHWTVRSMVEKII